MKNRIIAYFDGSNFYHLAKENYGLKGFDFVNLTTDFLDAGDELVLLKYFIAPVNQQEEPSMYSDQQRFFSKIQNNSLVKIYFGKLVTRDLEKINVYCPACKYQTATDVNCPKCARLIDLNVIKKTVEKGVDVKLAITLLLDAINNEFDTAYLFSSDADFVPAVEYAIKFLKKRVIYFHFPYPFTSELVKVCSSTKVIKKETLQKNKV